MNAPGTRSAMTVFGVGVPSSAPQPSAIARLTVLADIGEQYLNRDGLYQQRFHLTMLTGKFVAHVMSAYIEWCDWALSALDKWPEDLEGRHGWAGEAMTEWLKEMGRIPADSP